MYNLPQVGFVRMKDVLVVFPVSSSNWWAGVKSGRYPQPVPEQRVIRHTKVADPELIRQLAWIGNNINQISRVLNRSAFLEPAGLAGLFAMLAVIAEEMEAIKESSL